MPLQSSTLDADTGALAQWRAGAGGGGWAWYRPWGPGRVQVLGLAARSSVHAVSRLGRRSPSRDLRRASGMLLRPGRAGPILSLLPSWRQRPHAGSVQGASTLPSCFTAPDSRSQDPCQQPLGCRAARDWSTALRSYALGLSGLWFAIRRIDCLHAWARALPHEVLGRSLHKH